MRRCLERRGPGGRVQGFSLVEMAIVLVVVGLLLGGLLLPLSVQMENTDRAATQASLDTLMDALLGFAVTTGRLPCPDVDGDGREDRGARTGRCRAVVGALPGVTLSLSARDAWDRPFRYRVTGGYADGLDGTGCGTPTPGVSFSLCSRGDIRVLDRRGGAVLAEGVPALVFSSGRNWAQPPSPDERENLDGDREFVSHAYTTAEGAAFDDMVAWLSPHLLVNRMVEAGRLP